MTPKSIEKKIEKIYGARNRELEKLAAEVRQKFVIPACRRYGLTFAAGMGSYTFYDADGSVDRRDASERGFALALKAYDVMDVDVDSAGNLGVWISDVTADDCAKAAK